MKRTLTVLCTLVHFVINVKGKTGKEIHGELADVYGSSAPSYAQVKFWEGEFKRGRTSLEDKARSGRPLDAPTKECDKFQDLVYRDRRIQVEGIAQALGISHGSVSTILHDRLAIPLNLTEELNTSALALQPDLLLSQQDLKNQTLSGNLVPQQMNLCSSHGDCHCINSLPICFNGQCYCFYSSGLSVQEHITNADDLNSNTDDSEAS